VIEYVTMGDVPRAEVEIDWDDESSEMWRRASGRLVVKGVAVRFRPVPDGFRLVPGGEVEVDDHLYYMLNLPDRAGPMVVASPAVVHELERHLAREVFHEMEVRSSGCVSDPIPFPEDEDGRASDRGIGGW
jgi:hypothetical protein